MNKQRITLLGLLALLALGGCAQTNETRSNSLAIGRSQYAAIFHAAVKVLRQRGFSIDRKNYRFGKITTYPLISPTVFEPWKNQNATLSLALDSTVNEMARIVTVSLLPDKTQSKTQWQHGRWMGDYNLKVVVSLQRREYPIRRLIGSSGGYVFNSLAAVPTEMASRGITATYWESVGHDTAMEKQLVDQIVKRSYWLGENQH